ncbi:MAG: SAM-dependent methyltransferase, partial [Candidatus Nanopelagicales bacterium]
DAITQLGPLHPLASYLQIAPDLGDDAGIVDTFLHGREQAYSIDECRELVASAGLAFQDLFLKSSYYPPSPPAGEFMSSVAALPREQQWSIMQRINASNACHYFLACHPDRPVESYTIDVDSPDFLACVPGFRKGCGLTGTVVHRHDWQRELSPLQAALAEGIDDRRSIAEIAEAVASSGAFARSDIAEVRTVAVETFRSLWQQDFLAMGIRPVGL